MEVAEAAVVVDIDGQPVYWHLPAGRSATSIPDSRALWLVLWENRERLAGVAHTHPAGVLRPSAIDLRTFAACEDGLARRLSWWIVTPAQVMVCSWYDSAPAHYLCSPDSESHAWLDQLRRYSWPVTEPTPGGEPIATPAAVEDGTSDINHGRPATDSDKENP